jgi:signal transduction histidine kinase
MMPDHSSTQTADVARAYRRRGVAMSTALIVTAILIMASGVAAFSAINVLRALDYGQAEWAISEKSMAMALNRYIDTRSPGDYRDFEAALDTIDQARRSRGAIESGTAGWRDIAAGLLQHDEDKDMLAGHALFHSWPGFAAADVEWKQSDSLITEMEAIGRELHRLVLSGAPNGSLERHLDRIDRLDREMTVHERAYAEHIDHASRAAMSITLTVFGTLAMLACAGGIFATLRILSTGMRAETRALEEEQRLHDFTEIASDWFCEMDKDFRILSVSSRLPGGGGGRSLGGLLGHNWLAMVRPDRIEDIGGTHRSTMLRHEAFSDHRFRSTGANGNVTFWSVSGKPQWNADGAFAGYRTVSTDISSFIETQEELARARDEAERANRAKSSFLANMSHELRTPLNAILGFSELIAMQVESGKGDPRHGGYARDVMTAGRHLLAIINDLLEHSRIEAGQLVLHPEPFAVGGAIDETIMLCKAHAVALGVTLTAKVPAYLPPILGDVLRVKQVLINIVTNAVKFSPGGEVTVSAYCEDDALCIEVLDTGIGMDAAGIEQALKPFGQVDSGLNRKYDGTGLGVPLAKALTELQGGRFAITSKPGAGTRVTITMPLSPPAKREIAVAAR